MTKGLERRAKGTVLVVDDSAVMCEFLQGLLRQHGYETVVARNGFEGLNQLDATHVDLVIADIFMPGMDGLTLLEQIRLRAPNTPVVLITAWPSLEDTVRALEKEAREVLTKPVAPRELLATVDHLCSGSCVLPVHALRILCE